MFIPCTWVPRILCMYHYIPPQTRLYSLNGPTYNASVQESAIWCIHCSDRYVLPKNGCGRWSRARVRLSVRAHAKTHALPETAGGGGDQRRPLRLSPRAVAGRALSL